MQAPIPDDEIQRLHSLRQYNILDTMAQAEFDDIVHLASQICKTPIALISFVDQNRQWFKARKGLDAQQTARELSFCAHAILKPDELLIVTDTFADQRFRDNDLVTGEPHIRFYAGAPLVMSDGMPLGTLCVIDRVPRKLTKNQRFALDALRRSVVNTLELRRLSSDASARRLILYDVLHELARELDVDLILHKALNAIRQLNRWESIGISLPTADGQFWQTRVEDRMAEGEVGVLHSIYSGVIGRVYRTGETQFVADVSIDPNYFRGEHADQVGSELAIPIKFEGEVLGVLNLEAHQTQAFTQDDIDFAQSIIEIIAIALKNAQQLISLKHEINQRAQVENELRDALMKLEGAESQAGLGSWFVDLEHVSFWGSKELQRLLGLNLVEDGLSEEKFLAGFHPEDQEAAAQALSQVLQGKIPEVRDVRTNPEHGAVRILSPSYRREENETGQVVRVQGTLLDITERKQAEIELQAAKLRLQHLLTSSPAVIYSSKPAGDYGATFVSDNVRMLTGHEPEQFTGNSSFWLTQIHPGDFSTFLAEVPQTQAHETHSIEYRFLHQNGSYRWIRDDATLVRDADGNPVEVIGSWVDITNRKEAETERNAERTFRQAIEKSLQSGIAATDMNGVQTYTNPAFCTMVGWAEEELVNQSPPFVYWPPEEIELITSNLNNVLAAKLPAGGVELIFMRHNGERFPVQLIISPLYLDKEQIGWLANVIDITERKATESQLLVERARFKRLFELAPDGIMIVDRAGYIQLANPALNQMLGLQVDTPPATKIFDFVYSDYRNYCEECLLAVVHGGPAVERSELIFVNASEERFPVEIDAGFFIWNGEPAAQVVVRDITDRKRAELLEIEQRHIAYELHDGLAQIVAGAQQHLQSFAHHYRPRSPRTRQELASVLNMTQNAVKEVRRVMAGLRPTALDDFGLATALRLQVQALEVEGWEIDYEAPASAERLPSTVETVLFRIAQEAINNIHKHAQSTRVRIALKYDENYRLEIQDWGRGFDMANVATVVPGQHLGLRGMQERIVLVGGRLNIHSSPGAGTLVVAEVPRKSKE